MENSNKLPEAITELVQALKSDKDYRLSWSANIAMAFNDSYRQYAKEHNKKQMNREDIHKIANTASEYFLDLLCMDSSSKEENNEEWGGFNAIILKYK